METSARNEEKDQRSIQRGLHLQNWIAEEPKPEARSGLESEHAKRTSCYRSSVTNSASCKLFRKSQGQKLYSRFDGFDKTRTPEMAESFVTKRYIDASIADDVWCEAQLMVFMTSCLVARRLHNQKSWTAKKAKQPGRFCVGAGRTPGKAMKAGDHQTAFCLEGGFYNW